MKKLLIVILFLHASFSVIAQTKEGDSFFDVYYGFPDWQKYIMQDDYDSYYYNDLKIKSTGHIGARAEYMVSKRVGFGLDFWYVKTSVTATEKINIYENNSYKLSRTEYKDVNESLGRLAILGRFVVHIGNSKKIDPYVHAGFGYVSYQHFSSWGSGISNDNFFPLAARVGFGLRYFVTDKIGANVDLGIGGPLFTIGLTYKLAKKSE